MTQSPDSDRPERDAQEAERQPGQVSEPSGLGRAGPVGDADSPDKSTGTAPDRAEEPESVDGAAE